MRLSRTRFLRLVPAVLLAGGAAAIATPAAAQVQGDTAVPYVAPVQPDTPSIWMPDPAAIFLGHHRITPPPLARPLYGPRLRGDLIQPHWTDLSGRWWSDLDRSLTASRDTLWLDAHGLRVAPGSRPARVAVADSIEYLPYRTPEADTAGRRGALLPGRVGQYADLGMLVTGRGEMGGAWQRFEPCDAVGFNTCEQGLTPRLRPDLQFGVLLGGTITDRVHVSVDYDQTREFDAANNINVFYQGLEDEIVQRFEMGDVSITMPQSQFLAGGVPAGSFGFRALAQLGPIEVQSIWAQQQGDIGSLDINIDARTGSLYEANDKVVDDHDYESGRFFFLVDPTLLPGYPHIDVLQLEASDAPAAIRPVGDSFQLYRDEQLPVSQREASRVFRADATPPDPTETRIPGYFRRLEPGDYIVHSSGLWLMLRQPLGASESLAMSYLTESGDTVGTLDAGPSQNQADVPELQLLRGPTAEHHPDASTWDWEMHQVYHVYAGEIEAADLEVVVKLGDAVQGQPYVDFAGGQVPLLRLFGADENSPVDRIDPERIFQPSDFQTGTSTITGTYLVLPTLRPFAEPPPTRQLTAAQAAQALGTNANSAIYEERDPDLRSVARFRLAFSYRVRTDGLVSEFSLGGFGVREGSERLYVDGQALRRGTDYTVDYQTGMVRLTNPQQLFAGRQSPRVTAQFEQSALFEIAPKSIFGTTARVSLGQIGDVNLVGLYQNQRSVMSRPQLGNEPNSIMMGGMTTNLRFGAGWMDRALDAIPGLRLAGESSIGMSGELALSLPNPNTRGVAYLDDFEATAEVPIAMSQQMWRLGSRPERTDGAAGALPLTLDQTNAFRLQWQHQAFGRLGATYGAVVADSVDRQIRTAGRDVPEPVLYLSMFDNPELPLHTRLWRSITTVLSTRGSDLTSSEYFEFYATERSSDIALVFDIGTVSEDAFFFVDSTGALEGDHPATGQRWGEGVLDQEAGFDQPWGIDVDHGLWDEGCTIEPGMISFLGSPNANCTINNGINDTEDLNGDGVGTFEDGPYFRYVVPIGPNSPYLARDTHDTGSEWRLYRVPLRGPGAVALNGAGENTWRAVKHLRMTVTSGNCTDAGPNCTSEALAIARMRISGSTWKKRDIEGVLTGLVGTDTIPGDHSENVHVGPVSQLTDGGAYRGPPGAVDQSSDPTQEFGATGVEINEKGLRILLTDLEADARAEVFYRFPSETRNFMDYQQLRLWALPRAGDWGPDGTLSMLVKIGTDDGNYYMYRTRLRPPVEHRDITTAAYWLPEVIIDFDDWFELKARAETLAVDSSDTERAVWNDEGTHAIVLTSRAQSPNLAAIRELSIAVYNDNGLPVDSAELWVNDIRLGEGRTDAGFAGSFALDASAADFATFRMSLSNQDAVFHPMNRDATLEGANDIGLSGRFEVGHFAPAGWGLSMPVTVQHTRQDRTPDFLSRTDIRAADLEGLRESGANQTQVGVAVSKATPAANPWLGLVIDGARLSLNWRNAARDAFTSSNSTSQFTGTVAYDHALQERAVDVTPSFLVAFLERIAPARVEQSDFFRRMSTARLRWSPADVSFTTSYLTRKSETYNFRTVLESAADDDIVPIRSPQQDLDNSASIGFRPFESLTARLTMSSARDLLSGNELQATPFGQRAVGDERASLGGLDLGWEKSRSLLGSVQLQPRISNWLRPTIGWSSDYYTSRTPHYLEYVLDVDSIDDTTIVVDTLDASMQRDFEVAGQLERRLYLDPAGLVRAAWGAERTPELGAVRGALHRMMGAVLPFDLSWTNQRSSTFERSPLEPGYGYRFGLGSLSSLRLVDGDTAVTVAERKGFQARSGVRLPFAMQLDGTYAQNDREAISARSSRNLVTDRTWPDVRLGIATLPIPAFAEAVLARASASLGYRVERTEQKSGSFATDREAESVPVQFSTTFANGMSASYTASFGTSEAHETTGERRGRDKMHGVQLRATFDAPESLGTKFTEPMTASIGFNYTSNYVCQVSGFNQPAGETRCAESVDRLTRDIHFTIETMVDDLNLGAQFSLNDHQSFTGLREGQHEFRLAIFANFNFGVGILPEGLGANRSGF